MSSICGFISSSPYQGEDKSSGEWLISTMNSALSHRGPDGEGVYVSPHCSLGYRHFDVYGLTQEQSAQMLFFDRYAVTFDGRIYNLPELQEELAQAGYSFTCLSEAELLAASYQHWGVDCLNKFNGEWAFVLFDTQTEQYFIARDRFGIKPLYYYRDAEHFVFASEVKGIYASGLVEKAPNIEYLQQYLAKGPNEYDAPTAFANILRFPFAHYFLGTKQQLLSAPQFTRYWQLEVNESSERFDAAKATEYATLYYELLKDAVRIRMNGNVKIGAALSGGLDSSSIVYLMNEILKENGSTEPLETFSSVYKSDGTQHCDESEFIDLVAKELGVISHQIEPQEADIPAEHEKMIWAMENPPESTCMSGWHTFKKVQQCGTKATLDGQGADEQLAGYFLYIASYLTSISVADLYKEFFHFLKIPGAKKVLLLSFLMANFKLLFGNAAYQWLFKKLKGRAAPLHLNLTLKRSMEEGLITLIHYSDHVSNGNSIESRMPFTDHRLVEFLAQVPACYKMHNGWTKYLARLAFNKKLPDDITWRKDKMGWPIPEEKWFSGGLNNYLTETINASSLIKQLGIKNYAANNFKGLQDIRLLNIAKFEESL